MFLTDSQTLGFKKVIHGRDQRKARSHNCRRLMNALFLMRFVRPQKWQVILVDRHRLGFFWALGREWWGLRGAFNSIWGLGLLGLLNVTDKRLSSDSELCITCNKDLKKKSKWIATKRQNIWHVCQKVLQKLLSFSWSFLTYVPVLLFCTTS